METYTPDEKRYERIPYVRCGRSGLMLPRLSLGLWQNFGHDDDFAAGRAVILRAFDLGVTHFDLANNYGPPPGSAEVNFGRILKRDLACYRDELVISTKAGYRMWAGPYGEWGSRKNLLASLDQSLRRMGTEYVDIFYSHRFDPETPLEETMGALAHAVRQGKALYAGISNYSAEATRQAAELLEAMGVRCLIHQPPYNMFNRGIEAELLPALRERGIGCIVFSPLDQGVLTGKYLQGTPPESRVGRKSISVQWMRVSEKLPRVEKLNAVAQARGQTLSQLAITWVLRRPEVTSVLPGARSIAQLDELSTALTGPRLTDEEERKIDEILASA